MLKKFLALFLTFYCAATLFPHSVLILQKKRWVSKNTSANFSTFYEVISYQKKLWAMDFSSWGMRRTFTLYQSTDGVKWKSRADVSLPETSQDTPREYLKGIRFLVLEKKVFLYDLMEREIYESRDLIHWEKKGELPFPSDAQSTSLAEKKFLLKNYFAYTRILEHRKNFYAFVPQSWKGSGEVWKSSDGIVFEKISEYVGAFQEKIILTRNNRFFLLENAIEENGAASQAFWIRTSSDALQWKTFPKENTFIWIFSLPLDERFQIIQARGRIWAAYRNYQNHLILLSTADLLKWKKEKTIESASGTSFRFYSFDNKIFLIY